MSKSGRKSHSEKRKAMKKASKMAQKALYESYAKQGRSRKKENQGITGVAFNHEHDNCGNVGCKKCFPRVQYNGWSGL
jgi:hypothetical protein